jgi:molybdopterin biosynthesis enzyme MoaB
MFVLLKILFYANQSLVFCLPGNPKAVREHGGNIENPSV